MFESATFWAGLPTYIIVGAGFIGGLLVGVIGQTYFRSPGYSPFSDLYVFIIQFIVAAGGIIAVVAVFTTAMIYAVRYGELSYVRAALVIIIGATAILAAIRTVRLIASGEGIEVQNFWGGIGGGGSGWRLSPATSLMLFALLLTGVTIAIALPGKSNSVDGKPVATTSKPTSADPGPASAPPKTQ